MVNKDKRTLEEVLNSLDDKQRKTTINLQNLIKNIVPQASETIRHSRITYVLDGRDFVWLTQASGHVDVEFATGASLDSELLRTHGIKERNPSVRHVEVNSFEKYKPEVTRLLKDSARVWYELYPKAPTV